MSAYVLDWLNLVVRWAHVIAAISWIGASFFFVWLDDSLTPPKKDEDRENGVIGELWSVHGGGFYHNQKFLTGPKREPLTRDLHWFKWEAYSTWLSGMAMLVVVYWVGASTFLIDRSVLDLSVPAAIAISAASLVVGWLVYDLLCRVFETKPVALWTGVAIFFLAIDWT
ncbi:MAG TPA: urate hydroxylase PuuD, partial [Candidatus Elarobacter sp.]